MQEENSTVLSFFEDVDLLIKSGTKGERNILVFGKKLFIFFNSKSTTRLTVGLNYFYKFNFNLLYYIM